MNARRVLRETGRGLARNLSMVVSIVLVTFVSLTFVGAAALMQLQITQMKSFWYDKAQVAVYLCNDSSSTDVCPQGNATADQQKAVRAKLESPALQPYVAKVYFETKAEALKNFQQQFKGNSALSWVTVNDMADTFWVRLKHPAASAESSIISEALNGQSGVDQVQDQRAYLDRIFSVLRVASYTAIGLAALMLAAAILLISTTIRQSAFSRRKELGIMRLVGASNSFIQAPFVLEGVISALIGSVLACGALAAIVQFFVQGYLSSRLQGTALITLSGTWGVLPLVVLVGVVLAGGASMVAIRRYLRV
jgi:cell division transport system permease protein